MTTRSKVPQHVDPARVTSGVAVAAVASIAYVLCDALHELAHLAAASLPVGVTVVSISTIGLSTIGSSAIVAAAGPAANLLLGTSLLLVAARRLPPAWRYFFWLFGTVNLFDATAYLLYSALLGSGDCAVVFGAFAEGAVWRPSAAVCGVASYAGAIQAAYRALRRLVECGVVARANVDVCCTVSYWAGGLVLALGSVFNPVSWWYVLSSGAATGLGAMAGLLLVPVLFGRSRRTTWPASGALEITRPWVVAGAVAAALFIGVLGPGIRLSPGA